MVKLKPRNSNNITEPKRKRKSITKPKATIYLHPLVCIIEENPEKLEIKQNKNRWKKMEEINKIENGKLSLRPRFPYKFAKWTVKLKTLKF